MLSDGANMSASELPGLDREFNSLFRSQVRELESEALKTPARKRAITREQVPLREEPNATPSRFVREQRPARELEAEATPVRVMPKFKRNLVESRRAMRSREASSSSSSSFVVALSARIPMTVLVATTA